MICSGIIGTSLGKSGCLKIGLHSNLLGENGTLDDSYSLSKIK